IIPFFASGKAYLNQGYVEKFQKIAKQNIVLLKNYKDFPIIILEPAIYCHFKEEYQTLLNAEFAELKISLINEFLFKHLSRLKNANAVNSALGKVSLFLHCTEKTYLKESGEYWRAIFKALHLEAEIIESGCCGM